MSFLKKTYVILLPLALFSTCIFFEELVGSHLSFIGDRLDSVLQAAQMGTHAAVTRDEANRLLIYTYMLVGDVPSLGGRDGSAA